MAIRSRLLPGAFWCAATSMFGCVVPEDATTRAFPVAADASNQKDATPPPAEDAEVERDVEEPTPPLDAGPSGDAAPPADAVAADAGPPPPDVQCGPPPFDPQVDLRCPGDPACPTGKGGTFRAGADRQEVSDLPFEKPKVEYLETFGGCNEGQGDGPARCGALETDFLRNCGTDRLCPGDQGYVAPDGDGSEGDVRDDFEPIYDYYDDCGVDNVCNTGDEGEGNGRFDGLWLAGFQNNRPAIGVRDPLWARTVAVEHGDTLMTITSIDAVGVFFDDVQRIRERATELLAQERPDLDVDYMLVSSTHVHEAPDTMGQWVGEVDPEIDIPLKTGVSPRYMAHLIERAARSIANAVGRLEPAQVRAAEGRTGKRGLFRDSRDPQVINDLVGAIRFTDATDENTIATLVTWGNHPEAMSDVNNLITSDFAHGIREAMESGVPDSVATDAQPGLGGVSVYVQGTVGGLMTPLGVRVDDKQGEEVRNYTFLRTDIMGWRVAEVALAALRDAELIPTADLELGVVRAPFYIPVENRVFHVAILVNLFSRANRFFDLNRPIDECNLPHLDTEMAILRLGPITLYTVPGELFPELAIGGYGGEFAFDKPVVSPDNPNPPPLDSAPAAPHFSDRVPGTFRWPIGLGNDEIGYLVPEYDYELHESAPYFDEPDGDHYEETNSVGPQATPRVREVFGRLVDALTP